MTKKVDFQHFIIQLWLKSSHQLAMLDTGWHGFLSNKNSWTMSQRNSNQFEGFKMNFKKLVGYIGNVSKLGDFTVTETQICSGHPDWHI